MTMAVVVIAFVTLVVAGVDEVASVFVFATLVVPVVWAVLVLTAKAELRFDDFALGVGAVMVVLVLPMAVVVTMLIMVVVVAMVMRITAVVVVVLIVCGKAVVTAAVAYLVANRGYGTVLQRELVSRRL